MMADRAQTCEVGDVVLARPLTLPSPPPIARAFENAEVKRLIAEERKDNPDLYTGFEGLAREMLVDEAKARPKPKPKGSQEIKRP